jgi:hypothetical protein
MKIKEIYINDFRQFSDFTLNLTYPNGHPKAGAPLEKVCFIGQSGTGKTTLLNLLYILRMPYECDEKLNAEPFDLADNVAYTVSNTHNKNFKIAFKGKHIDLFGLPSDLRPDFFDANATYDEIFSSSKVMPINTRIISQFLKCDDSIGKEKIIYFPALLDYQEKANDTHPPLTSRNIFDFSKKDAKKLWEELMKSFFYIHGRKAMTSKKKTGINDFYYSNIVSDDISAIIDSETFKPDPVSDLISKCINPLIGYFGLRVKSDIEDLELDENGYIKLESTEGQQVPYKRWSSGTRQVILSAVPLYLLKPENSAIFFDEPERSLYPDLQRILINNYQGFTTNSQSFYATHSPIIASSFEPWEIVELKFDKNYKVYREKYYEGENHVDNYTIDPRFLDYDMVLKKVFDMEDTNSDMRYAGLAEYEMLKNQLAQLRKEGKLKTPEGENIFKKFDHLAEKLAVNP